MSPRDIALAQLSMTRPSRPSPLPSAVRSPPLSINTVRYSRNVCVRSKTAYKSLTARDETERKNDWKDKKCSFCVSNDRDESLCVKLAAKEIEISKRRPRQGKTAFRPVLSVVFAVG